MDLPPTLQTALIRDGLTKAFPIQAATIPDALAGRDVLGRGRTGSGKTLAFGLPILARLAGQRAEPGAPLALVLAPTRELAQQVAAALVPYARGLSLRVTTVVGGVAISRQISSLRRGTEVVVATPGRLTDLIERGSCRLDQIRTTVLDEADQMADMGFLPQVTRLLDQVAPDGQRMLFSATLDRDVDQLVRRYLSDPVRHSVDPPTGSMRTMEHHLLHVADADKQDTVAHIGARDGRTIMFVGMKHAADRLARQLLGAGVRAAALHGGKSQAQRNRTLEQFRGGHINVLVATDVAARGIHIDGLDLVVNVDPPTGHKEYLHRGGRTARAGESGTVVSLVLPRQRRGMTRMLAAASVRATTTRVRPGDEELARVTGARQPSGVAVTLPAAPDDSRRRRPTGPSRHRRGRPTGRDRDRGGRRRATPSAS